MYQSTRFPTEGPLVLNLEPRPEVPAPFVEAERASLRRMEDVNKESEATCEEYELH